MPVRIYVAHLGHITYNLKHEFNYSTYLFMILGGIFLNHPIYKVLSIAKINTRTLWLHKLYNRFANIYCNSFSGII